jgi:hypothetical protein
VWRRLRLVCAVLLVGTAAMAEEIGSWVLACPAGEPCVLRHRTWIVAPGTSGISAALEARRVGSRVVPVIAVRGLSMQAALASVVALQANVGLRFDDAARIALSCGLDGAALVCAPARDATEAATHGLARAQGVLVQAQLSLPGVVSLPDQSRALELQRTAEALARLHASSAQPGGAAPAIPGLDLGGMVEVLLEDVGLGRAR